MSAPAKRESTTLIRGDGGFVEFCQSIRGRRKFWLWASADVSGQEVGLTVAKARRLRAALDRFIEGEVVELKRRVTALEGKP